MKITENFEYIGTQQNFERDSYATLAEMKAAVDKRMPDIFTATCKETGKFYIYNKNNEVDETLGKWRELSLDSDDYVTKTYVDTELVKKADTDHTHTTVNGHTVESDVPVDAKFTDTIYDDTDIKAEIAKKADITSIPSKVSELTNDSNYQTAEQISSTVTTEIAKVVANAPENFDTLKEMSDWIAGHEDDASAMNSAISDNKTAITSLQNSKADTSNVIDIDYMNRIDKCTYSQIGKKEGYSSGYLRQYHKINKMVVIGNSITMHGRAEADGIEWLVDDYREMAATYPNSGWVSLVRNYLAENVSPDIKVYKTNGSVWERQANGSRDYATGIGNQRCAEVKQDRSYLIDNAVCDDLLTDDVDVIILQLSENMDEPTTDNDKNTFATDFKNLYTALLEKCPNAQIFQHCGFWANYNKFKAINSAMITYYKANIIPIFAPFLYSVNKNYPASVFQSSVGAEILDGGGNVITTVTAAVATHPGDKGFKVMANQTLQALFNSKGINSYERRPIATGSADLAELAGTEIFITNGKATQAEREEIVANALQWFLFPGEYIATITYPPSTGDRHGYLEVHVSTKGNQYLAIKQEIFSTNAGWERIWRRSILSATSLDWGAFEYPVDTTTANTIQFTDAVWNYTGKLGNKRIAEIYITFKSDFSASPSSWSTIEDYNFPFKCKIIQAYVIPCSQTTTVQDYYTGNGRVRIGNFLDDLKINLASISTESAQTFNKGDVIYIKIIEL